MKRTLALVVCLFAIGACGRVPDFRVSTHEAITNMGVAVELYRRDCGAPPAMDKGLEALVTNPGISGWNGPYCRPPIIRKDAWGTAFRYRLVGTNFVIQSAGPDCKLDTPDDIF